MAPKFRFAKDTITYHLAMLELIVKIDDSLVVFMTNNTNQYFGLKWAPFHFKLIVTQSFGEYTMMALQTAPNVIGIGSQTVGADGEKLPKWFFRLDTQLIIQG